jgi:hypothetical protein
MESVQRIALPALIVWMAGRLKYMSINAQVCIFQRFILWLLLPCWGLLGLSVSESALASGFIFSKLPTTSASCSEAQSNVSQKLKSKGFFSPFRTKHPSGEMVTISPSLTIADNSISNGYYEFPKGYPVERSQSLSFNVTGDFISLYQGLLSSPLYLTALAAEILASCPSVGEVTFAHWHEGGVIIGYFPDNTARRFIEVDVNDTMHSRTVRLGDGIDHIQRQWGYYFNP